MPVILQRISPFGFSTPLRFIHDFERRAHFIDVSHNNFLRLRFYPVSQVTKFFVANRTKNVSARDPASRFRLLTKHRCDFTKCKKLCNSAEFLPL